MMLRVIKSIQKGRKEPRIACGSSPEVCFDVNSLILSQQTKIVERGLNGQAFAGNGLFYIKIQILMIRSGQTPLGKEEHKRLNQIIQQLIDSHDSVEFRQPVDHRGLGLHDYLQIIRKPMDLGTVQKKLSDGEYRVVEECLDDIQLIWDNCKLYNGSQSWISKLADKLERSFKKHVKNYLPLVNLPQVSNSKVREPIAQDVYQEEPQEQVSYNDKVEFSNSLKQLQPEQIGLIVHMIQNTCPNAFVEIDREKYQIIIDNIEPEAFSKCQKQIQSWIMGEEITKKPKL